MRRTILFSIILLFCVIPIFSEDIHFRGFPFGSHLDDVIEKEGIPSKTWTIDEGKSLGNNLIQYNNKNVAGYSAQVEMEFDFLIDGIDFTGLIVGTYSFTFDNKVLAYTAYDPTEYINCYVNLKKKLSNLYGDPIEAENELFEITTDISALLANSISESAPYATIWDDKSGRVFLQLSYKEGWNLLLMYMSPVLRDYFDVNQKAKEEDTTGL